MNNQIKLLVTLFTVAIFSVSLFAPSLASAQTNEQIIQQLKARIEQLQAQIKILQQQLGIASPTEPKPTPAPTPIPSVPPECPMFSNTLYRGVSDQGTGGEVTKLQKILAADPAVYPEGLVTGHYGSLTEKAVQRWQAKQGIVSSGSPATTGYGVVGTQTRTKMIIACPTPPPIPSDSLITVLSPNGGEQWALESNQSIQWVSGPIAAGSALAQIAYVDIDLLSWSNPCKQEEPCPLSIAPSFSVALARKISNTGVFSWTVGKNLSGSTIPTGFYVIRISNSENPSQYDQGDAAFNIVKESGGNLPPSISGVSGPSVLKVGEVGKWEVKASDPEQGPLTYSVVWGDETVGTGIAERAIPLAPSTVTQTATFTHVYSKAGTYTPTFTVTDNGGLSAKTSVSVSVTGGTTTNSSPVINGIPAIPSNIKVNQSVSFSWDATDTDGDNLAWSVSWGDGTGVAGTCQSPNPQNKQGWTFNASHAWASSGTYTVKATVNDCRGGSGEHAFSVTVGSSIQPFVTVLSPNGGETWTKGIMQTIKWQDNTPIPLCPVGTSCALSAPKYYDIQLVPYYPPCTGNVCSALYVAPYTIAKNVHGSSYNWSVGKILNKYGTGDVAPDGSYTIRICQTGSTTCDSSDNYFKIISSGSGEIIIRKVGEQEGSFLIQKINPDSVEGLWYQAYPVPKNTGTSKTLRIGDDIGYACEGVSEKLTSIDYSWQTVTFTKIVGQPPYGGCPICLASSTLIDTPSGLVPVKDLQVGMPIWTTDKAGHRIPGIVTKTSRVPVPPTHLMVRLVLSDGRELFVSPGHPTIDGRTVGDLVVNDFYDGARVVTSDRVAYGDVATYDILPSGETGFYWANGVLLDSTLH